MILFHRNHNTYTKLQRFTLIIEFNTSKELSDILEISRLSGLKSPRTAAKHVEAIVTVLWTCCK